MNGHLDDKIIGNIAAGTASKSETMYAEEHIRSCSVCREQLEIFKEVLGGNKIQSVPGEHVKNAVLAEWHRANRSIKTTEKKPLRVTLKFASGFAAVLLVALSVYFSLFRNVSVDELYSPEVASVSGNVTINGTPASVNAILRNGDRLLSGDSSVLSALTEGHTIFIGEKTGLTVAGTSRETGLDFSVIEGSVYSKSEGTVKYMFRCGSYMVVPTGTEFIVQYANNSLEVAVLRGGVLIKNENMQISVTAGMIWNSGNPGRPETADPVFLRAMAERVMSGNNKNDAVENKPGTGRVDQTGTGSSPVQEKPVKNTRSDSEELRKSGRDMRSEIRNIRQDMKQERKRNGMN